MNAKEIIAEYNKSKIIRAKLEKEEEREKKIIETEKNKVYDEFREKERKLADQRTKAEKKISMKKEESEQRLKPLWDESYKPIEKVLRVIELLKKEKKYQNNPEYLKIDKIIKYSERDKEEYKEDLGSLYDDEFLKISASITINRKPKNCYSLVIYGRCLFGEDFIKFPRGYGFDFNHEWLNILFSIKDGADLEEIKEYFNKNKEKILSKCKIEEYNQVKKEYLETIKDLKIEDFEQFRSYIDWRGLEDEQKQEVRNYIEKNKIKLNNLNSSYLEDKRNFEEWYDENQDKFNFKEFNESKIREQRFKQVLK